MYRIPRRMVDQTFATFRSCGDNQRECQLYWLSPWDNPIALTAIAHPRHWSSRYGLSIESKWIDQFWNDLANQGLGVRMQVHTHPSDAFHSQTDDTYPLLFDVGFLSLVIPDFAMGPVGFHNAYLTEIQSDGSWKQVDINSKIIINE